jgi:trans-aconitate 2-methyltransferase
MIDTGRPIRTMVDLGCGDGELSVAAADRLEAARLTGIDASPAMIERATTRTTETRRFELGDLATWHEPASVDIVLANASLQWVPDHAAVLARWVDSLVPGGRLVVQVPANGRHPSHAVIDEVAHTQPFLDAFGGTPPANPVVANVAEPEWYATLLHDLGCVDQHVRLQVYGHVLPSSAAVVDWVRGTNLNRIFAALPVELHEPFVDTYRTALLERLGEHAPYFYAFRRILFRAATPA